MAPSIFGSVCPSTDSLILFVGATHHAASSCSTRLRPDGAKAVSAPVEEAETGTFTAIFFLECIAALELEQIVLEEI
jgi:hypothetical protein